MTGAHQVQLFVTRSGAGVNWRLLAGNNREAGRGPVAHPSEDACRRALSALRCDLHRAVPRIHRVAANRWSWELQLDGHPVAVAGPSYDRLIRCEQVLTAFLDRFAAAGVGPSVVDVSARRWTTAGSVAVAELRANVPCSAAVHPLPAVTTGRDGAALRASRTDRRRTVCCEIHDREPA